MIDKPCSAPVETLWRLIQNAGLASALTLRTSGLALLDRAQECWDGDASLVKARLATLDLAQALDRQCEPAAACARERAQRAIGEMLDLPAR